MVATRRRFLFLIDDCSPKISTEKGKENFYVVKINFKKNDRFQFFFAVDTILMKFQEIVVKMGPIVLIRKLNNIGSQNGR